jgi:hypothetical protein
MAALLSQAWGPTKAALQLKVMDLQLRQLVESLLLTFHHTGAMPGLQQARWQLLMALILSVLAPHHLPAAVPVVTTGQRELLAAWLPKLDCSLAEFDALALAFS